MTKRKQQVAKSTPNSGATRIPKKHEASAEGKRLTHAFLLLMKSYNDRGQPVPEKYQNKFLADLMALEKRKK